MRRPAALEAADAEQLERVLGLVRDVLGPDLAGAYLHGSATFGGLRPRSDLDVLAVSKRPTTRRDRRLLVDGLLAVSGSPSGARRPVELTIVVESDVRPWRYPPRRDFQYGEWLRPELESGDVEPQPATTDPDLASLIRMALLADRPLQGPPPAEIFDPVPEADYVHAIVGCVDGLLHDLDGDTTNAILTLARVWSSVATGVIRSKDAAADWALARLPGEHREVLAHARGIYLGATRDGWEDLQPRVEAHAHHVAAEIARLAGAHETAAGP